mgnify:CR=1 FL=1
MNRKRERVRNGSVIKVRKDTFEKLRNLKLFLQQHTREYSITYTDIIEALLEELGRNETARIFEKWLVKKLEK